ncbi:MAG: GTPase domain-containing protein [Kofleriaceae bacterium]
MAALDVERDAVVVRVVYDGPPFAGKTTSVRALARSLDRVAETPLEVDGRTIYFDWLEYTGGLFEGHRIHCQIVSVPGQPELDARRKALLNIADVVIFVVDSADLDALTRSVEYLRQLAALMGQRAGPPVGIIVQANKQDLPGSRSREEVQALLGEDFSRIALTESNAATGMGIRETFVFAVRLALDRLRVELEHTELALVEPKINSASSLLLALESTTGEPAAGGPSGHAPGAPPSKPLPLAYASVAAPPSLAGAVRVPTATARDRPPRVPSIDVESGALWPPVEGRMLLHEAAAAGLVAHRIGEGEWAAGLGTDWRVHSSPSDEYKIFSEGRRALIHWAREHARCVSLLSPQRCVALGDTGLGTWRLWQVVRGAQPLRDWLIESAHDPVQVLHERLVETCDIVADMLRRCEVTRLCPRLSNIGRRPGRSGGQYVGLMPALAAPPSRPPEDIEAELVAQLGGVLAAELAQRSEGLERYLVEKRRGGSTWDAVIASAVAASREAYFAHDER